MATVSTLVAGIADGEFWPGRSFSLWEGRRKVGGGIVREMALPAPDSAKEHAATLVTDDRALLDLAKLFEVEVITSGDL